MKPDEAHPSRASLIATRIIGPVTYILLLARVQLIAAVVLVATLSDWAIPGSMREAMRYSVIDAPWQLAAMALGLALACAAIRFTSEATIELVAPDLFAAPGNVGRLARILPRALSLGIAIAVAMPLLTLALDPRSLALYGNPEGKRGIAALAGVAFVAIGAVIALFGRVRTDSTAPAEDGAALPLRAALAALPLAFSIVICGAILGVWRDGTGLAFDALARYQAGGAWQMAIDALALYLCCVSARLAAAIVIELVVPRGENARRLLRALRAVLPRLTAVAVGGGLAAQFLGQNFGPGGVVVPGSGIWVGAIAAVYLAVGLFAAFSEISWSPVPHATNLFERTGRRWRAAADRLAVLSWGWGTLFAVFYAIAFALAALFVADFRVDAAQWLGPVAIILLWGFSATLLFFPVAYASHMTRMPLLLILTAAGVGFAGFDLNDNHEISSAQSSMPPGQMQTAYRENIDLGAWMESRADWNRYAHYPVFLVATEGGGIRAAYFTATVLTALQDRCPLFAQHTLAISGVSGGSVGAAAFAALTADRAHNLADAPCDLAGRAPETLTMRARNVLAADLLSPLIAKMLFADSLQRILPVAIDGFDRARAIEQALEQSWRAANADCASCAERMAESASALYAWPQGTPRPPIPHLFLNTTEAKSGRIIPFATGQVVTLATPFLGQAEIDAPGLAALRQLSLQDLMTNGESSAPLSTAAMLSARFPYITPAGFLANSGHYVDGGYFENSGTSMLSGLLQNLIGQKLAYAKPGNPALEAAVRNAVFVTIIIHSEPCATNCEFVDTGSAAEDTSWNEVMSPIRALLNTREQRAEYAITDLDALTALVEQLSPRISPADETPQADDGTGCGKFVCSVTLRFGSAPGAEVPLTWLLSRPARDAMDEAVDAMMRADVRNGVPASAIPPKTSDLPSTNVVLGSYSRILCLLADRPGAAGCAASR